MKLKGGALAVNDVAKITMSKNDDVGQTYVYTDNSQVLSIVNFAKNKGLGSTGVKIINDIIDNSYNDSVASTPVGISNIADYINQTSVDSDSYTYNYLTFENMHVVENPKGYEKGTVSIKGNTILHYVESGQTKELTMNTTETEKIIVSDTKIKPIKKVSLKRISQATYTNKIYPNSVISSKTNKD